MYRNPIDEQKLTPQKHKLRLNTLWNLLILAGVTVCFSSCENDYAPKPRGFQRIQFPIDTLGQAFISDCGFKLNVPFFAIMEKDNHPTAEKCWYNLNYEPFGATLHLSYKSYKDANDLFNLTEDARTMVYKHTIKAEEIYETQISNAYMNGMLYELSGNTATNFQFYVMDTSHHFIRGALYFNTKTNNDSVAPVLAYLKTDILKMLKSLRWK